MTVGSTKSAAGKLAAVSQVPEPKDINWPVDYNITAYNLGGQAVYKWNFHQNVTDVRVLPSTTQASTVEIDLDDSNYDLLQQPIFSHWAFDIQNVSLSSSKKFKTSRLANTSNTSYLGDDSDLEWVLGQRPIDYDIGGVNFRLCSITTQDTVLTLTFEDLTASLLRDKSGFKSVRRGTYTRAGFVALLCREAGVDYWIPEIDVAQPIEASTSTTSLPALGANAKKLVLVTGKGVTTQQGLTSKGQPLNQSQVDIANILLDVGVKNNAPKVALVAIIVAAIAENSIGYDESGSGRQGPLSPLTSAGYGSGPSGAINQAEGFFLGKASPSGTVSFNAAIPAASKYGNDAYHLAEFAEGAGSQYDGETGHENFQAEAEKIVEAYLGGKGGGKTTSVPQTTTTGTYAFQRGPNEDSYDCIQRLASEVAWYAFVRQNRLWFVSGNYLFQQQPQLTIEARKNGVDSIDLDLDMGAVDSIAQCTVNARTDIWAALPGMVVQVNKRGPATGKWMVSDVENHPLDLSQQAQITLQKAVPKRAEPADTTSSPGAAKNRGLGAGAAAGVKISAAGYVNPFSKIRNLVRERIDMGVDLSGWGPILAIGDGTIVCTHNSGWNFGGGDAFITWQLTNGPYAGKWVYFAEGIDVQVESGTKVKAGDVIGQMIGSSSGIECGWAWPDDQSVQGGSTLAAGTGQLTNPAQGHDSTAAGVSFNRLLVSLGCVGGILEVQTIQGIPQMPKGYP